VLACREGGKGRGGRGQVSGGDAKNPAISGAVADEAGRARMGNSEVHRNSGERRCGRAERGCGQGERRGRSWAREEGEGLAGLYRGRGEREGRGGGGDQSASMAAASINYGEEVGEGEEETATG
jgi:hypothetical protein